VQRLHDFGRFEMNKRDLGRQRQDQILVAQEEILDEIENQPRTSTRRFANHLGVSQFVVWLRIQNAAHEIRQNGGILNRVRLSWTRRAEACIANDGSYLSNFFDVLFYAFTHNCSLVTLLFSE
jgi:hypothetical protein